MKWLVYAIWGGYALLEHFGEFALPNRAIHA